MESISLKMEGKLLHDIDHTIKNHRYSTRTEFIRDAIRMRLNELEKEEFMRQLSALRGKFHSAKTDEEIGNSAIKKIAKKLNISLE